MFLQSQKFTLQDEVIYHQVTPSLWKWQLPYYSSASQFFANFVAYFAETQAASNRPVYFRDLWAAYTALPENSSRITFQPRYANLLSSKITHVKFSKAGNLRKNLFQRSENFIETNNTFAIRGKKLFIFQLRACKQDTICVTKYRQLNKFLTVHIKPFSNLDRKYYNEAQKRQQDFIQIILHCHISNFFYLCRVEYKINVNCQTTWIRLQ